MNYSSLEHLKFKQAHNALQKLKTSQFLSISSNLDIDTSMFAENCSVLEIEIKYVATILQKTIKLKKLCT